MAVATKDAVAVTKMVPIVEQVNEYELRLSEDEAQTLFTILQFIGGDPATTRRGHADAIRTALKSVGIVRRDDHADDIDRGASGIGIHFKPN